MGKVFTGQTNLRIMLSTNIDLTGATSLIIKCKKPNGTVFDLAATVNGSPTNGKIYYDFTTSDDDVLDTAGTWSFWAYVVFADSRIARGETATLQIYNEV